MQTAFLFKGKTPVVLKEFMIFCVVIAFNQAFENTEQKENLLRTLQDFHS
jgi:hypothetical protein